MMDCSVIIYLVYDDGEEEMINLWKSRAKWTKDEMDYFGTGNADDN